MAISTAHGLTDWLAWATSVRGWAMAQEGDHEEGIAQSLNVPQLSGAEAPRPYVLSLLADAYIEAGRFDDGLSTLIEALIAADKNENRFYEAETHRLKGGVLLGRDNPDPVEAQSCFERAIEVARKQSAKSLELRATMSLARLLGRQGRRDEARAMLADVYGWFREGFDTADLKDAKACSKN
jgi:predicted ATPase